MKTKYYSLLVIVMNIIPIRTFAQIKPLLIGDEVPDIKIELTGFKNKLVNLSSFKGKLLIIDFWATWCSPCVAMLPKTDSLQTLFDGQVQFLPISTEKKEIVQDFLEKIRQVKHLSMSSSFNDTIMNTLFEHHSIPYYVWIDQKGRVIATTEGSEVNETNIATYLNRGSVQITNTIGTKLKILNPKDPLYRLGFPILENNKDSTSRIEPIIKEDILYQSIVTKYNQDLKGKLGWDSVHFYATNVAIINLYRLYYGLEYKKFPYLFWSNSRCKIEVKDSTLYGKINSKLSGRLFDIWLKTNGYNYEIIWKNANDWQQKRNLLKEDLKRYFSDPLNITTSIEKRLAISNILIVNGKKLITEGGAPEEKHDAFSYLQRNLPLSHFIDQLQGYFWQTSDRVVFDETNFKGNVDLDLRCNMNDLNALNKELSRYGLKFVDGERMADVLVIKDK